MRELQPHISDNIHESPKHNRTKIILYNSIFIKLQKQILKKLYSLKPGSGYSKNQERENTRERKHRRLLAVFNFLNLWWSQCLLCDDSFSCKLGTVYFMYYISVLKKTWRVGRNSLAVQWLRPGTFTERGRGLIPRQGTKIQQATMCGQKIKDVGHYLLYAVHSTHKTIITQIFQQLQYYISIV